MKIKEYPRAINLKDTDCFLSETDDGTRRAPLSLLKKYFITKDDGNINENMNINGSLTVTGHNARISNTDASLTLEVPDYNCNFRLHSYSSAEGLGSFAVYNARRKTNAFVIDEADDKAHFTGSIECKGEYVSVNKLWVNGIDKDLTSAYNDHRTSIVGLNQNVSNLSNMILGLSGDLSTHMSNASKTYATKDEIAGVNATISNLDKTVKELDGHVSSLQSQVQTVNSALEALTKRVQTLENKVGSGGGVMS